MTVNTFRTAASPARGADGTDRVTGRTAFTQSVARRTLWKLAIRVAIVILAVTGTAYDPVFPLVTEKSLEQHGGGIEFETGQGHHTTIYLWFDPSTGVENSVV